MKIIRNIILVVALVVMTFGAAFAVPAIPPKPYSLVGDYAGLFTAAQNKALEDSLLSYERQTSTQLAVITVASLDGLSPAEYATEVINQWGVGQKGKDNGVVLLLKPRNQEGGGEVFIATGYGAEGALPDILCGRIIDSRMMPHLQNGDYYSAVQAGTQGVKQALEGEFTAQKGQVITKRDSISGIFGLLVIILVIISVIRNAKKGDQDDDSQGPYGGSSGRNARHRGAVLFPPIIGGFGGGMGGGSSSGGFGGFGGFGGGMSGGGGGGRSF